MKRRGFFGLMGGAAVAGPSMVKAAAAQGMEAMNIGNSMGLVGTGANAFYGGEEAFSDAGIAPDEMSPLDPRHWVQRQLSDFLNQSAEEVLAQRLGTSVQTLDPDLAVSRSFSLAAKMRIQRDRNFERNRTEHKNYLLRDIKSAVKRWTERGAAELF